jgi:hypothetical protein
VKSKSEFSMPNHRIAFQGQATTPPTFPVLTNGTMALSPEPL